GLPLAREVERALGRVDARRLGAVGAVAEVLELRPQLGGGRQLAPRAREVALERLDPGRVGLGHAARGREVARELVAARLALRARPAQRGLGLDGGGARRLGL